MSNPLSFSGKYLFGTLNWFLDTGEQQREILMKMQERFHGTPAVVGLSTESDLRAMSVHSRVLEIRASNPYLVAAYNTIGAKYGTRGIFPWELEQVIAEGKWQRDTWYVDGGLTLDFSGRNHTLALDLYEQLPREQRILERLPAVIANVHLERTEGREGFPHGLRFVVHEVMEFRHAPTLFGASGYFDSRDAGLERTGVPEKILTQAADSASRYLWNAFQKERSLENMGISGLYLGSRNLNVYADGVDDLADSYEGGRVVPVFGAEGAPQKKVRERETRTPLVDIELAPDGEFYHEGEVWLAFQNSISWMKSEEDKERARSAFREGMRKKRD